MLGHQQERRDPALAQHREQLVQLQRQRSLLGHRVQIAVEAVDDDDPRLGLQGGLVDRGDELPRPHLRGIDLLDEEATAGDGPLEIEAQAAGAQVQRLDPFVEGEQGDVLAAGDRRQRIAERQRRLARPGRPDDQRGRPPIDAAAEQGVQIGNAAREDRLVELRRLLGRHQTREDAQPALDDRQLVIAAARLEAPNLHHPQPPPLVAVVGGVLLEHDDAVGDALQLPVVLGRGPIVEEEHGAPPPGEELLEHQDLTPIAQRVLGQQAQLRQRIEHHPAGLGLIDLAGGAAP